MGDMHLKRISQGTFGLVRGISEGFPKEITPEKEKWKSTRRKGKNRKGIPGISNSTYKGPVAGNRLMPVGE